MRGSGVQAGVAHHVENDIPSGLAREGERPAPKEFDMARSAFIARTVRRTRHAFDELIAERPSFHMGFRSSPGRRDLPESLHWASTRAAWQGGGYSRKALLVLLGAVWPLKSTIYAFKNTRKYGRTVRDQTGISLGRQFAGQVKLALQDSFTPRFYYTYRLYDPANRELAPRYIEVHVIPNLVRFLPRLNIVVNPVVVHDKRRFAAECKRLGFPTAPLIAEFDDGKVVWRHAAGEGLPRKDLFVKMAVGARGEEAERWTYDGDGRYESHDEVVCTESQLVGRFLKQSKRAPYVVEERMFNHPDLPGEPDGALNTIRVMTCRPPSGPAEFVAASFRISTGEAIIDTSQEHVVSAPVDRESGTLGIGRTASPISPPIERHPDTGESIPGTRLPYWGEIDALCLRAHDEFPPLAIIGWDVAVTKDGPVFVEGNPMPGSGGQRYYGPVADRRLGEVLIAHMNAKG